MEAKNNATMVQNDGDVCRTYNFLMHCVVIGLLAIFGTAGNLVSFIVFTKDNVKTSTSFLLQALAVIDSIFLVVVFITYSITTLLEALGSIEDPVNIMIFTVPFAFVFQTATVWMVVLVGRNRYIAVCKPFKAVKMCTVVRAKKQLTAVIIFSFVYNVPKFLEGLIDVHDNKVYEVVYANVMYTICMLALPIIILIYINYQLIRSLKNIRKKRLELHQRQSSRHQQGNNVTVMLIVVVVVLIICQTPAFVNHLLLTATPIENNLCPKFQYFLRRASNVMAVMNSAVNFPIYLLFNKRFRKIFGRLLPFFCQTSSRSSSGEVVMIKGTTHPRQSNVTIPLTEKKGAELL